MRYITYISVAVITFFVGFTLSSILRTSASAKVEMLSVAELRNDDYHRLFEAAHMAKDEDLRDEVLGRLQCAGDDGFLGRRLLTNDKDLLCCQFEQDSSVFKFKVLEANPYYEIIKTHGEWSRKNMAFVYSVSDPKAARRYIQDRLEREKYSITSPSSRQR
jgi:hypothetical protein